jgi:hypothetical protein
MNQCPPGPQVFCWGRLEFFRKFAEIFANEYVDTGDKLFNGVNDTGEKFIASVVINLCHGEITKKHKIFCRVNGTAEKLFTGVNDTADKLFGGVNDTGD